ncbi:MULTISPECIES: hypothetical protein [unclassified Helicobacter]|uniref:hypothetical protein n=1 Tax=unclassified Helicobacter TaxID=2593540 RepID=UPI0015F18DAC|nr:MULTISPECIES: hypothetical protein [unclassified Helicobacter]
MKNYLEYVFALTLSLLVGVISCVCFYNIFVDTIKSDCSTHMFFEVGTIYENIAGLL